MKRNIAMIIELNKNRVIVSVFEKLTINFIKLFALYNDLKKAPMLLERALAKVKIITHVNVKNVFVVLDPALDSLVNIKIVSVSTLLKIGHVTKHDLDSILKIARQQHLHVGQSIILEHPLQFIIDNDQVKSYQQLPLQISGNLLTTKIALTSIATSTFQQIKTLTQTHNLNIKQIFVTPQTLANCFITKNAMRTGAILIHFEATRVIVTINKNGATVSYFIINSGGLNNFFEQVQASFHCSRVEAQNLVLTYGSLEPPQTEVIIYTKQFAIKELSYTNQQLHFIVKTHLQKTLKVVSNYVCQNRITHLPFIISGQITNIDNVLQFIKNTLQTNVLLYEPAQYLEVDFNNANALGAFRGYETLKNIYNDDIVTTATSLNNLENLLRDNKSKQTLFHRIINKLGEKYERND